jgi:hypothetical protein
MTYSRIVVSGQWSVASCRDYVDRRSRFQVRGVLSVVRSPLSVAGGSSVRARSVRSGLPLSRPNNGQLTTDNGPIPAAPIGELSVSLTATRREVLLRRSAASVSAADRPVSQVGVRRAPIVSQNPRHGRSNPCRSSRRRRNRIAPQRLGTDPNQTLIEVPLAAASDRAGKRNFHRISRACAKPSRRREAIRL